MNQKSTYVSFEGLYLSVMIETPHYLTEYVEYPIRVSFSSNQALPGESYSIVKRYSDFDALKKSLKNAQFNTQLPPKKMFGKFDMNLVNERQILLEKFLKNILSTYIIGKSVPVCNFFQKSNEIVVDYSRLAFQQISLDFRCETNWQICKALPEIGCRIKKSYINVNNLGDPRKHLMSWSEFGPEYSPLNAKVCQKFLKTLTSLKHEYIYPIVHVSVSDTGVSIIRLFSELGSLHDLMCRVKPINSVIQKYNNQTSKLNLTNSLSLFGRQILLGLKYLHEKGIPYGHLHLRNVLLFTETRCGLSDIENSILGLLPQDRHFYVGILKKLTFEEIDIYCFGRLIFEMIFGEPLNSTFIANDDTLVWPTPAIREFMFSILTEEVLKGGFPTIDSLLELNLFKSYNSKLIDKSPFKISASCKELLLSTQQYSLKRLSADQKLVKSQRRKLEADAIGMKKKLQRKEESRRTKNVEAGDFVEEHVNRSMNIKSIDANNNNHHQPIQPTTVSAAPPPPPPPPPPAPTAPSTTISPTTTPKVGQLLNAISGFNKGALKKTVTNDKSAPKI